MAENTNAFRAEYAIELRIFALAVMAIRKSEISNRVTWERDRNDNLAQDAKRTHPVARSHCKHVDAYRGLCVHP